MMPQNKDWNEPKLSGQENTELVTASGSCDPGIDGGYFMIGYDWLLIDPYSF